MSTTPPTSPTTHPTDTGVPPIDTATSRGDSTRRESSHRVTKALIAPYRIVWLAVSVAIIVPLICLGLVWKILDDSKDPSRVIVVDSADNFIVGPMQGIDQSPIFERTARLATLAAMSRHARGFDFPEMVEGLFYKDSLERVKKDLAKQLPNLQAQNLHQKVEISRIETVQTLANGRKIYVYGNIGRSGVSKEGQPIVQSEPYRLILVISPNPKFGERGTYPYIVFDCRIAVGANAPKPK